MNTHARPNDENSTQRNWHDLKPGDVIWFATCWHEVYDAYPSAPGIVTVKLIVRAAKCPARIETYRVRTNDGKATCQA